MTITFVTEDLERYDTAASPMEINSLHKELYEKYCDTDTSYTDIVAFQELSRRAFERFTERANPHMNEEGADDVNVVAGWKIRNWCAEQGIPLAKKGRVSLAIENQYRVAHDLPEREPEVKEEVKVEKAPRVKKEKVVSPPSEIALMRAWGKENGFEVGLKGRLKPELVAAYEKVNK